MAKILEFGCGGSPTEWLPSSDLLDDKMCTVYAKSFGFDKVYNQLVNLATPHIDCPDNTYSYVRANCSILPFNKHEAIKVISDELYRITAHGGMVTIEDSIRCGTSIEEFRHNTITIFEQSGWRCSLFIHALALSEPVSYTSKNEQNVFIMLKLEKDMPEDFDESCPRYFQSKDGCETCSDNMFKEVK